MNLAGRDLTKYMFTILQESNVKFDSTAEFDIAKDIKEIKCRVALDFKEEMKSFELTQELNTEFQLPDGNTITFGNQQIRVPELMFDPSVIGKDFAGVHVNAESCIQNCDIDVRRDLWENIILSGGNTMFPNMKERLTKELKALAPPSINVKVLAENNRKCAVWIGGATMSTLSSFQDQWVTKQDYEEHGKQIVHKKCF